MGSREVWPVVRVASQTSFAFACLGVFVLTSCSLERDTWTWTEDVQLSDGKVIQVRQSRSYRRVGEWARPSGMVKGSTLEILGPDIKSSVYNVGPEPLLMDRDPETGAIFMVAIISNELVTPPKYATAPLPRPNYMQFRLVDGAWVEEPLSDKIFDRKSNLLVNIAALQKQNLHVTVAVKEQLNGRALTPRNYRVLIKDTFAGDTR